MAGNFEPLLYGPGHRPLVNQRENDINSFLLNYLSGTADQPRSRTHMFASPFPLMTPPNNTAAKFAAPTILNNYKNQERVEPEPFGTSEDGRTPSLPSSNIFQDIMRVLRGR